MHISIPRTIFATMTMPMTMIMRLEDHKHGGAEDHKHGGAQTHGWNASVRSEELGELSHSN